MKVYYAHCIALYGSPQELRDLVMLQDLFRGAEIINPADRMWEDRCQLERETVRRYNLAYPETPKDASHEIMEKVFKPLATWQTHALAFRALPDGRIPAGVGREVQWAVEYGNPVIELPSNLMGRGMTVDQTRAYLREVGQR